MHVTALLHRLNRVTAAELQQRVRGSAAAISLTALDDPEHLTRRLRDGPGAVDVLVLGAGTGDPIQTAQRAQALDQDLSIILLCPPDRYADLKKAVMFAPFLGSQTLCRPEQDAADLAREIEATARASLQRREFRTMSASLDRQSARPWQAAPSFARDLYLERMAYHAPVGIVLVDGELTIQSWNRKATEIFGREERDVLGRPLADVLDAAASSPPLRPVLAELLREPSTAAAATVTIERERTGGTAQYIDLTCAPVVARGAQPALLLLLQDVTARRENEAALARSKARFRRLFEANVVGMLFSDLHGAVLEANDAFLQLTGYSRADLVAGKLRWTEMTPPEHRAVSERALAALRTEGVCAPFEKEYLTRDGRRVPVLVGSALLPGTEDQAVTFVLDISERKAAERAMAEALRARDEFLSVASHELRTPLASLKLQTGLMRRLLETRGPAAFDAERLQKTIETSDRHLDRLARLIDDMLDISRIATGRMSMEFVPVDLAQLTAEVIERLRPQFEAAGCTVALTEAAPDAVGRWDGQRIEQVIVNLLTNAFKYGAGNPVTVRVMRDAGRARLEVEDRGIGIAPENHERIFERFERAVPAAAFSGLGLGLYIVRKILEAHGGSVRVASAPGRGTTFTVELPLAPAGAS